MHVFCVVRREHDLPVNGALNFHRRISLSEVILHGCLQYLQQICANRQRVCESVTSPKIELFRRVHAEKRWDSRSYE